jgi:phosphate transport system substrate-binding protein
VRYLKDTLLAGAAFGKNIMGAKNSQDLINYISTTPSAIGFVGISWITNPQNKQQEEALTKVKMALIECKNCEEGVFAKPSQQTITFKQYPLVRGLYYVLKENYAGLGSRFVQFLTTERGQLIFRRALLVPTRMQFNRRRII